MEEYLPNSQAAYRPTRSTTDIVWAHKIAIEQALKMKSKQKIIGIDLSSAFDTINRKKLFETLESMIPFSEVRLIGFLLKETTVFIRL